MNSGSALQCIGPARTELEMWSARDNHVFSRDATFAAVIHRESFTSHLIDAFGGCALIIDFLDLSNQSQCESGVNARRAPLQGSFVLESGRMCCLL